jgi:hypothetical protein
MAVGKWSKEMEWDDLYRVVDHFGVWEAGKPKSLEFDDGGKLAFGGFVVDAAMLPDSEGANAHLFEPTIAFAKAAADAASKL